MATSDSENAADRYSVRQVSEMLDLSPRQIRALVADGAIVPTIGDRGKFLFSFRDLVLLRSIAELVRSGVAPNRIRSALAELKEQLPDDVTLAEVTLDSGGGSVVVTMDATAWEPVSGQTVLDLDTEAVVKQIASLRAPLTQRHTSLEWFVFADEIETADPAAAERAYRESISLDPTFADAHLNLGRILHAAGAVREALSEYEAARDIDSGDATIHYNIGVASQDLGDLEASVDAYERAIALAPRFADALFNLASVYEELGHEALAIQHLRTYKELAGDSS